MSSRPRQVLEMLHLGKIPVRDDDLIHLRPLTNLTTLVLRSPHITDRADSSIGIARRTGPVVGSSDRMDRLIQVYWETQRIPYTVG